MSQRAREAKAHETVWKLAQDAAKAAGVQGDKKQIMEWGYSTRAEYYKQSYDKKVYHGEALTALAPGLYRTLAIGTAIGAVMGAGWMIYAQNDKALIKAANDEWKAKKAAMAQAREGGRQ